MEIRFVESALLFAICSTGVLIAVATLAVRWWRHELTASTVAISIAVLVLLAPTVLHFITGVSLARPWFGYYLGSSFIAIGLVELWRARVMWRVQRRAHLR